MFNPSATVAGLSEYLWKLEQPAHAVANGYFVGAINRVGTRRPGTSASSTARATSATRAARSSPRRRATRTRGRRRPRPRHDRGGALGLAVLPRPPAGCTERYGGGCVRDRAEALGGGRWRAGTSRAPLPAPAQLRPRPPPAEQRANRASRAAQPAACLSAILAPQRAGGAMQRRSLGNVHGYPLREPVHARLGAADRVREQHPPGVRGRLGRRRHEDDRPAPGRERGRAEDEVPALSPRLGGPSR